MSFDFSFFTMWAFLICLQKFGTSLQPIRNFSPCWPFHLWQQSWLGRMYGWRSRCYFIPFIFGALRFKDSQAVVSAGRALCHAKRVKYPGFSLTKLYPSLARSMSFSKPCTLKKWQILSAKPWTKTWICWLMKSWMSARQRYGRICLCRQTPYLCLWTRAIASYHENLVLDLTYNVENLVDMREMIVNKMESDRALMVRMFLKVGQKEINFIWHISALIGFVFGILQMAIFWFVPQHWQCHFLPRFGGCWPTGLPYGWYLIQLSRIIIVIPNF